MYAKRWVFYPILTWEQIFILFDYWGTTLKRCYFWECRPFIAIVTWLYLTHYIGYLIKRIFEYRMKVGVYLQYGCHCSLCLSVQGRINALTLLSCEAHHVRVDFCYDFLIMILKSQTINMFTSFWKPLTWVHIMTSVTLNIQERYGQNPV